VLVRREHLGALEGELSKHGGGLDVQRVYPQRMTGDGSQGTVKRQRRGDILDVANDGVTGRHSERQYLLKRRAGDGEDVRDARSGAAVTVDRRPLVPAATALSV